MVSISNINGDIVTERVNTPGVMTPILEIQPRDGTGIVVRNHVERGEQTAGFPIFGKFLDSNGDPLPLDTKMAVQFEGPNADNPETVTVPFDNIRAYRTLSIQDQQNEEYIDRVKHKLKGEALVLDDVDRAYLSIESSAEIDWANSRAQVAKSATTEV